MTSIFFGTCASPSAPVEETTVLSSISMPGSRATSEPVAMTMLFVSNCWRSLLFRTTPTLPGPMIVAVPW